MTKLQRYQMFIDGKWVDAADGRTFTPMNPSTGDDWSEIPAATAADVNRAAPEECPLTVATAEPRRWRMLPELVDKGARAERCTTSAMSFAMLSRR